MRERDHGSRRVPVILAALLVPVCLAGCASSGGAPAVDPTDPPTEAPPPETTPDEAPDTRPAPPLPERPTLTIFDCGSLRIPSPAAFGIPADTEVGRTDLFVPCYLVEHPGGRLLFDVGLPAEVAESPDGVRQNGMTMTLGRSLVDGLAEVDLSPSDIDFLAMSHLHFDHCGQAADFASSTLLIQRPERDAAFGSEPPLGFDRRLYADLADSETVLLDGDHDVFGDGSVVLLSTPGHTPGHQSLLIRLEETGNLVLSGDLYHFPESRELRAVPPFNWDVEATRLSMERIEELLAQTGAELWIEHDADLADSLRKAPNRYR